MSFQITTHNNLITCSKQNIAAEGFHDLVVILFLHLELFSGVIVHTPIASDGTVYVQLSSKQFACRHEKKSVLLVD